MSFKTLEDVLYHGLKDLLSAEKQFRDGLSKLSKAAQDSELAKAFSSHESETKKQITRLEKCFELLGKAARSEKCEAAAGLAEEANEIIEEGGDSPALDVMLTASGRKTEHYEIASYTDAIAWAKQLGHDQMASLLTQTLQEEQAAAEKLQRIGERLAQAGQASLA